PCVHCLTMPTPPRPAARDLVLAVHSISRVLDDARRVFPYLAQPGVDMPAILSQLQVDALAVFSDSFHALMLGVDTKRKAALLKGRYEIAGAGLGKELDRFNVEFQLSGFVSGMWAKKAELWSDDPGEQKRIANRLGWLDSPELMAANLPRLRRFADSVRVEGFQRAVLHGMGGSSPAP